MAAECLDERLLQNGLGGNDVPMKGKQCELNVDTTVSFCAEGLVVTLLEVCQSHQE